VLRQLDSGELKALPEDVECSFMPASFRKRLFANPNEIDRRTWQIGLALALSDALRAGDIYLPDSCRHVSFWELCYGRSAWQQQRPVAYRELGLPVEADTATTKLVSEFLQTADRTAIELPSNRFAAIVNGQLQLKRDPAIEEPMDTLLLRQMIKRHFSRIRIEWLLFEVDGWCGFSNALRPLGCEPSSDLAAEENVFRSETEFHRCCPNVPFPRTGGLLRLSGRSASPESARCPGCHAV
jgi:hypothetical protein